MAKHPCTGCRYWRTLNAGWKLYACHYSLDTDKLRGCPPREECTQKQVSFKRKRFGNLGTEIVEGVGE